MLIDHSLVAFQKQPFANVRKFCKSQRKHLCQSFCFNKVAGLQAGNFLRKRLRHRCFPVNLVSFLYCDNLGSGIWALRYIYITNKVTNLGGHSFYGDGIFLTLCTCKPTNSKSLFSIICYVLVHFLFLYYTDSILKLLLYFTCSSVMEALKVHRVGEKLLAFNSKYYMH